MAARPIGQVASATGSPTRSPCNGRYRKKPIIIDAFQLTVANRESNQHWPSWAHEAWQKEPHELGALVAVAGAKRIDVVTLEGRLTVSVDDWIIRGVKGELYPCKPDIFAATYEDVT